MANTITQKLGFDATQATKSLTNLTKKLDEANDSMKAFQQTANTGGAGPADQLPAGEKKVKSFTLSWKSMLRSVATRIATGAITKLIGGMKDAIANAVEFRLRLAEIQTIGKDLEMTTGALSDKVLSLSAELGKGASDVAEGLYQVLSNQVVEAADAFKFLETSEKLAIVTHGQTKDAVNAISSVMNSYGKSISEVDHVADILFKTVEEGRLRLADIADILGRVTPLTAKMGVNFEEAAAAIAVMTRSGVKADTAVTQLRAVMQKLIKPTDKMKEIFKSWGVQDGPQAIKTFGGLTNVLKKLSEEVGGSDAEMAELFKRVRAIVGQMGIMTEEGQKMNDVMKEMADATGAAKEAWDSYAKTDAHQLTASWQALKVALIDLGEVFLPTLTKMTNWFGEYVEGVKNGMRVIMSWYDRSVITKFRWAETQKKIDREIEESRKQAVDSEIEGLQELRQAAYQVYADINKREQRAADIRDDTIARADATYKAAGDKLVKHYEGRLKALEKFINEAGKRATDSQKEAAKIGEKIDNRLFKQKIDRTHGVNAKIAKAEEEHRKRQAATAKAIGELDGSKASKEAAQAALDRETASAEMIVSLRKQQGHAYSIHKAEDQLTGVMMKNKLLIEESARMDKVAVDKAKEKVRLTAEATAKLKELVRERRELETSPEAKSDSPEVQKNLQNRLKAVKEEMSKVYKDLAESDEFLRSLGLETAEPLVEGMLQDAYNSAHIPWEREVARGEEAFKNFTIDTQLQMDPTGAKQKAAQELIGPQGDKKTGDYYVEASEKGIGIMKEVKNIKQESAEAQIRINNNVATGLKSLREDSALHKTISDEEARDLGTTEHIAAVWSRIFGDRITYEKKKEEFADRHRAQAAKDLKAQDKHTVQLKKNWELQRDGVQVGEEALQKQYQSLKADAEAGRLKEAFYRAALAQFEKQLINEKLLQAEKKRTAALEELAPKNVAAEAIDQVNKDLGAEQQKAVEAARLKAAEEQKATDKAVEGKAALEAQSQKQGEVKQKTSETAVQQGNAKVNAEGTATAVGNVGSNAVASVSGINQMKVALESVKQVAIDTVKAIAAAKAEAGGATATAYHGAHMRYFKDGGAARGQDTIPTMLSKGETVTSAKNSKRFFSQLNAMNQGSNPVYREQGGPVTNVGDVNVTVQGGDTSSQTVREIGNQLRREIHRGTIKLS
jgi:TP901 family phage tail tape measure protein